MAKLGVRKFQELIGRVDFLKVSDNVSAKAKMLNFEPILKNALDLRPGTNIVGGSKKQVRYGFLSIVLKGFIGLPSHSQ